MAQLPAAVRGWANAAGKAAAAKAEAAVKASAAVPRRAADRGSAAKVDSSGNEVVGKAAAQEPAAAPVKVDVVAKNGTARAGPQLLRPEGWLRPPLLLCVCGRQLPLGIPFAARAVMSHEPFTALEQDQLDWMSRFADRLRLDCAEFAEERHSHQANEIARTAWERSEWRTQTPEQAAQHWLAQRSTS